MVSRRCVKEETMTATALDSRNRMLAAAFVHFLETGEASDGLFAPDVFCDLTVPHWRLQAQTPAGVAELRRAGHPAPGKVVRERLDETATGFVLEFEERWTDAAGSWYAREIARADVGEAGIESLSIYCTGDWDEARVALHRAEVSLIRP
jgi:hypothetical protein